MPTRKPSTRGFASMDKELQLAIASKGGHGVPDEKRTFTKDRALASRAGRIGGANVAPEDRAFSRDPALASAAGRLGGRPRKRR